MNPIDRSRSMTASATPTRSASSAFDSVAMGVAYPQADHGRSTARIVVDGAATLVAVGGKPEEGDDDRAARPREGDGSSGCQRGSGARALPSGCGSRLR